MQGLSQALMLSGLGVGGVIGAQIGARLVEHVSTAKFKKVFVGVPVALAIYLFMKK